jgi:hypothetical protein
VGVFGEKASAEEQTAIKIRPVLAESLKGYLRGRAITEEIAAEWASLEVGRHVAHHENHVRELTSADTSEESDDYQRELSRRSMTRWIVTGSVIIAFFASVSVQFFTP